ncbi:unnamed protein product [Ranitomeya imitator]|uniref:Transcription factor A, mitochondrial n=1 Tax=Ranitomeya imitator TaxID=111125 RepID=A0ABN9LY95_9NEOB|nr:unnamed protein product [Ranitomeya imitator]
MKTNLRAVINTRRPPEQQVHSLVTSYNSICSSLPGALPALQCSTTRWFSKQHSLDDLPKRPLTSYFRFVGQQRPKLVKDYPQAKVTEICKMIALEWKGLSESARKPFVDAAREEQLKYKDEVRKYKEKLSLLELELLKERKKQRLGKRKHMIHRRELTLLGKPKGSRNSFNIFMSEHFHDTRGDSLMSTKWNKIPHILDEESFCARCQPISQSFKGSRHQASARHACKLADSSSPHAFLKHYNSHTSTDVSLGRRTLEAAVAHFLLLAAAYTHDLCPPMNGSEKKDFTGKMKTLHEDWNRLPHSQKQMYVQLAQDDKIRYENEIKAWEEQMLEIGREDLIRRKSRNRLIRDSAKMQEAKSRKEPHKRSVGKVMKPAREGKKADTWKNEE